MLKCSGKEFITLHSHLQNCPVFECIKINISKFLGDLILIPHTYIHEHTYFGKIKISLMFVVWPYCHYLFLGILPSYYFHVMNGRETLPGF